MSTLIEKFISLSFPLKFLLSLLFGIIAGPGLLAFLSEYATYIYAINHNIRPPLEGIPYLSASVALISLILSIIAISIFLITRWLIKLMVHTALYQLKEIASFMDTFPIENSNKIFNKSPSKVISTSIKSLQDLKWKQAVPIIIAIPLTILLFIYGVSHLNSYFTNQPIVSYEVLRTVFIYIFIVLLSLWKPIVNWLIAILFAILFYISSFNILFDTKNYSNYLQVIKYGGNINITLEYKDTKKKEPVILLLRTRDYIFIKSNKKSQPIEVPLDNIRSITYESTLHDINTSN